jgi:hypothetical protein
VKTLVAVSAGVVAGAVLVGGGVAADRLVLSGDGDSAARSSPTAEPSTQERTGSDLTQDQVQYLAMSQPATAGLQGFLAALNSLPESDNTWNDNESLRQTVYQTLDTFVSSLTSRSWTSMVQPSIDTLVSALRDYRKAVADSYDPSQLAAPQAAGALTATQTAADAVRTALGLPQLPGHGAATVPPASVQTSPSPAADYSANGLTCQAREGVPDDKPPAKVATADLDGDGAPERIFLHRCAERTDGGNLHPGQFWVVFSAGAPFPTPDYSWGDKLLVRGSRVEIDSSSYSANAPRCCPDMLTRETFKWTGTRLVRTAKTVGPGQP